MTFQENSNSKIFPAIELFVTSKCTEACELCNQQDLMKHSSYNMSLESVNAFIHYTKKSNYKFRIIRISGGDALLWTNLVEGVTLLKKANITNNIEINTAANLNLVKLKLLHLKDILQPNRTFLRVSNYWFNQPGIKFLKEQFGFNKLKLIECRFFETPPTSIQPISNVENSVCDGPSLAFYDNKIIWCPNLLTLMHRFNLEETNEIINAKTTNISENYVDNITSISKWGKEVICGGCVCCTGVSTESVPNNNKRIKNSPISIIFCSHSKRLTLNNFKKCINTQFATNHSGLIEFIFCGSINQLDKTELAVFCRDHNFLYQFLDITKNTLFSEVVKKAFYENIFMTHSFIKIPSDLITVLNQRTSFSSCFIPNIRNRQSANYVVFGCNKNTILNKFPNISLSVKETKFLNLIKTLKINITRTWHELSYTEDLRNNYSIVSDKTHLDQITTTIDSSKHTYIL